MIPVITCCSTDEVLRSSVTGGLLLDLSGAVVVRHDIDAAAGTLRRVVSDATGILEDRIQDLAHTCLGCALREDIVPALREVAFRRPSAIVLALPVTAEPVPVLRALVELQDEGMVSVGAVVTSFQAEDAPWDLCGDDLLSDRGLALSSDDERAMGEVLTRQIEGADVVVLDSPLDELGEALVDHLTPPGIALMRLHEVDAVALLQPRSREEVLRRGDPLAVEVSHAPEREGVWTVELESWRPFHPDRLMRNLETLGSVPGRSRGVFWLPTRPNAVCQWDGTGGQLSIGELSTWSDAGESARTRIVVTGIDGTPDEIAETFAATLLTDSELAGGLGAWAGRADGFDPWLGEQRGAA